VFHTQYDSIIDNVPNKTTGNINIKELVDTNKESLKPILGIVFSLLTLIGANIIAFILY